MEVFLGVLVSLLVQGLKKLFGTSGWATLAAVVVLSLGGAVVYEFLVNSSYWDGFVRVFTSAGAFYAFIWRNLSK